MDANCEVDVLEGETLQSTVYSALVNPPPQNQARDRIINAPHSTAAQTRRQVTRADLSFEHHAQSAHASATDGEASLSVRCVYEFAYTFFLLFASGVAVTDDASNSEVTQTQLLGISFTVPQFVIGVASHGTLGNSWLSVLVYWVKPTNWVDLLCSVVAQNVGGIAAMLLLWFLRGRDAVCLYQPTARLSPDDGMRSAKILLVEFVFCLLYGFLFLKLMYRTASQMRHLAMTAFIYIGIVATAPFSGFGANFVRNVAPGLICFESPDGTFFNMAGQLSGYLLALCCYLRLYSSRTWV